MVTAPGDPSRGGSAGAIYQYLEKEIIAGRLVPGQLLDDAAIGTQFSVSRTPVREAFLQLAAVDLIQIKGRQGAIVAAIPLGRMAQMFEVMAELEALCASLAADRMTLSERRLLKHAAEECADWANNADESSFEPYFNANYAFHDLIYRGAHNEFLYENTVSLRNRLTPYRRFRLQSPARLRTSSRQHDEVLDSILKGESECAARLMRNHLTIQSALLADIVSSFGRETSEVTP